MISYWYTKSLMGVPHRYFRLAELNGDSNPQCGCCISFYTSYTFFINTNNATIRRKFSLLGINLPTCGLVSRSQTHHALANLLDGALAVKGLGIYACIIRARGMQLNERK